MYSYTLTDDGIYNLSAVDMLMVLFRRALFTLILDQPHHLTAHPHCTYHPSNLPCLLCAATKTGIHTVDLAHVSDNGNTDRTGRSRIVANTAIKICQTKRIIQKKPKCAVCKYIVSDRGINIQYTQDGCYVKVL